MRHLSTARARLQMASLAVVAATVALPGTYAYSEPQSHEADRAGVAEVAIRSTRLFRPPPVVDSDRPLQPVAAGITARACIGCDRETTTGWGTRFTASGVAERIELRILKSASSGVRLRLSDALLPPATRSSAACGPLCTFPS